MSVFDKTVVTNSDVAALVHRLSAFRKNALECDSAKVPDVNEYDQRRLYALLERIDKLIHFIYSHGPLDFVNTDTMTATIDYMGAESNTHISNSELSELAAMAYRGMELLVECDSARTSNGLLAYDHERLVALVTRMFLFMQEYIQVVQPLDAPASQPHGESVGEGSTNTRPTH